MNCMHWIEKKHSCSHCIDGEHISDTHTNAGSRLRWYWKALHRNSTVYITIYDLQNLELLLFKVYDDACVCRCALWLMSMCVYLRDSERKSEYPKNEDDFIPLRSSSSCQQQRWMTTNCIGGMREHIVVVFVFTFRGTVCVRVFQSGNKIDILNENNRYECVWIAQIRTHTSECDFGIWSKKEERIRFGSVMGYAV